MQIPDVAKRVLRKLMALLLSRPVLYTLGGIAGAFLLLNYVILPWYVYHGGTLSVPDVTKMPLEEARKVLTDHDLVAIESETILDNSYPVGTVVTQNPAPNSVVKYGRHVYLTVCTGEIQVVVPMLRGRSLRDARFALERNGLVLGEVYYAESDSSPVNTIISQTVAPAERVKKGEVVSVTVSAGKTASMIEVPDVSGKSLTEGERILLDKGLRIGNIAYQISATLLPNTIVGQVPLAGTPVDSGVTVDLFVVKAGKIQDEN